MGESKNEGWKCANRESTQTEKDLKPKKDLKGYLYLKEAIHCFSTAVSRPPQSCLPMRVVFARSCSLALVVVAVGRERSVAGGGGRRSVTEHGEREGKASVGQMGDLWTKN